MRLTQDMRALVFLALPTVLFSAPVRADEGGLPQFDSNLFPEQIFWLVITFAVLYGLMSLVALPRVARTQDNRKKIVASELEAAQTANDKAKAAMAVTEKSMKEARATAQAHVSEMLSTVAAEAAEQQATKEKEILRRLHHAEADIAVAREAALKSVGANANDLAAAVVEKILGFQHRAEL